MKISQNKIVHPRVNGADATPPAVNDSSASDAPAAGARATSATTDLSPHTSKLENAGAKWKEISGIDQAAICDGPKKPAKVRAAFAVGEETSWNETVQNVLTVNHKLRGGGVLVAAMPGSTIRIYNRMEQGEIGKPKLLKEVKVHPRATNNLKVPFSMGYEKYAPHGAPKRPPAYHAEWTARARSFASDLQSNEVAVSVPIDAKVGDDLMVVTVDKSGVESDPLRIALEGAHENAAPRKPVLHAENTFLGNLEIYGEPYAATPNAPVHLMVNGGIVATHFADDEGAFSIPYESVPGQTIEIGSGDSRLLVEGTHKTVEQRLNRVANRLREQLSVLPSSDNKIEIDIDGVAANATVRIELPEQHAVYEIVASAEGRIRETIDEVSAKENIRVHIESGDHQTRFDISHMRTGAAADALASRVSTLLGDETQHTITSAIGLLGEGGALEQFATNDVQMMDALMGYAIANANFDLSIQKHPARPPEHQIAKLHYYLQDKKKIDRANKKSFETLRKGLVAAGASDAALAGFDAATTLKRNTFGLTTVRALVTNPGTEKVAMTGGGDRGSFRQVAYRSGEVWTMVGPGITPFLFSGNDKIPANIDPDLVMLTAELDQTIPQVRVRDGQP